jgi:hypothetical protein
VNDLPIAFEGDAAHVLERRGITEVAREELDERLFALTADQHVDVRRVDRRICIKGGEIATPYDRDIRVGTANREGDFDRRCDLRPRHYGDANERMLSRSELSKDFPE